MLVHLMPEDMRAWLSYAQIYRFGTPGAEMTKVDWARLIVGSLAKWPQALEFLATQTWVCTAEGIVEIISATVHALAGHPAALYHDTHNRGRVYSQSGFVFFCKLLGLLVPLDPEDDDEDEAEGPAPKRRKNHKGGNAAGHHGRCIGSTEMRIPCGIAFGSLRLPDLCGRQAFDVWATDETHR